MLENEYLELFGRSSERTRRTLMAMSMLAISEAGLENSFPFLADCPVLDLKGVETIDTIGEFTITEDGEYVRSCIDDHLPTIAIATHTFSGQMELMAANLENLGRRYNIIGLTGESCAYLNVFEGSLYTHHGFIAKPDGSIVFGGFLKPIKLCGLEESDLTTDSREILLDDTDCVLFSGGNQTEIFRDKSLAKEKFRDSGIPFIPGVKIVGSKSTVELYEFIQSEIDEGRSKVVIKPAREQSGQGVSFCDLRDPITISNHLQQITDSGQNALVERFIEPFTITGEDGSSLWSNIRAASIGCMSDDSLPLLMHARIGEAGKPSNVFCGAEVKSTEWLMEKAEKVNLDTEKILANIIKSQKAIRETGVKTFGADYIIDGVGNVYLMEVNTTYFGAIQFKSQGPSQLGARVAMVAQLLPYLSLD